MKYKFQHMHSWRSVAQRYEHWETMPEVPGSNPARSPQWIICSGGAEPDQRDDGGEDQTKGGADQRDDGGAADRTRPRVEQTREMMEEMTRPERWWRRGPDQGWSRPERWWRSGWPETGTADRMEEHVADRRLEQQTGWRSMWLETGTADRMEEHAADQVEWQPKQWDNSKEESKDSTRRKKGGPWPWSPPPRQWPAAVMQIVYEEQMLFPPKQGKITCKLPTTSLHSAKGNISLPCSNITSSTRWQHILISPKLQQIIFISPPPPPIKTPVHVCVKEVLEHFHW